MFTYLSQLSLMLNRIRALEPTAQGGVYDQLVELMEHFKNQVLQMTQNLTPEHFYYIESSVWASMCE
jgi:hypothetical protein